MRYCYFFVPVTTAFVPLVSCQSPSVGGELPPLVKDELDRCGLVVDAHLHLAPWFADAAPLVSEMEASGVTQGVIMAVYGPTNPFGTDPNQDVTQIVSQSNGALLGLASLNTTGDWNETRETELERLSSFLDRDGFVGAKIANPHTCLALDSAIMAEIVSAIASSPHPVLGIHIGTTPFCGPFGDAILGKRGCCGTEYVDPALLEPLIESYPEVTFVFMHSGFDFLDADNPDYYNGTMVDSSIEIASMHENVFLELSAFLKVENGGYQPLALETMQKLADSSLSHRIVYGSDANAAPGQLLPYLNSTIQALISTGFTPEERCAILVDNPRTAYGLDSQNRTNSPTMAPASPTTSEASPHVLLTMKILSTAISVALSASVVLSF